MLEHAASLKEPLSNADFQRLVQALGEHASFDSDGLLGVLHAVAMSPTSLEPSSWLPLVFAEDAFTTASKARVEEVFALVMRQYNEVLGALADGSFIGPPPEDIDSCALFAEGFVLAAELDDAWTRDEEAWKRLAPLAYLADLRELVSEQELATFDAEPEAEAKICESLDRIVADVSAALRELCIDAVPPLLFATEPPDRNEACPCGSGKKYKRCCAAPPVS